MESHFTNAHVVARLAFLLAPVKSGVFSDAAKAVLADAGIERGDYYELQAAGALIRFRERTAAILALDVPEPVRAFMLADTERRDARTPEPCDMRHIARRALATESQYGKPRPAWKASGDCRVQFSKAWSLSYEQQSYADVSRTLILFTGNASEESTKRLSEFVGRADSHTGWAGSGCNWYLESVGEGFVVVSCRASIAD